MDIQWKNITLDDKDIITKYYKKEQSRSCENTFANNFLWAPHYGTKYAIVENTLVFISGDGKFVTFPAGKTNVKEAIDALQIYFEEQKKPFSMYMITKEKFDILQNLYPGKFQIEYDRNAADYIYESEKLSTLSGKKLHSKRNHINRFKENNPSWSYEPITAETIEACTQMARKWCKENGCTDDKEKKAEMCVTLNALKYFEVLGLKGGMIKTEAGIVAFTIGEECSNDTFVVHIEKAFAGVQGAYPMINQQFIEHEGMNYKYINREEDTGAEGLRKAKLSYYPIIMEEKGVVTVIS